VPRPDLELLRAWKRGDTEAGDELVTRHFERLYTFFDGKVGAGVEDLAQRTFLACLEAEDRIREDGSFRAYLFGIARKVLLQHFARVRRDGNPPDPAVASADALGASPSRVIAQREEQRLLLRALRKIPLDLQIAVELFFWEELSIAEIAEILEVPEGTVKSRLHRAKGLLRDSMEAEAVPAAMIETTLGNFDRWAKSLKNRGGAPSS
jgi:RNA polymerase sigma-70 factor (ECF subfamily)